MFADALNTTRKVQLWHGNLEPARPRTLRYQTEQLSWLRRQHETKAKRGGLFNRMIETELGEMKFSEGVRRLARYAAPEVLGDRAADHPHASH